MGIGSSYSIGLQSFTRIVCAPVVQMFYLKIIEHDLDESYLKLSLFRIVVKATPKVITEVLGILLVEAPFMSELEFTSELLDRVAIDLWGEVRDPFVSKKKIIPFSILITKICQRARWNFLYILHFSNQWVPLIPHLGIEVKDRLRVPLVLRRRCVIVELRSKLVKVTRIQVSKLNFVLSLMHWMRKFLHNPPCCLNRFLNSNLIWRETSH
ncbi:hypothetical protein CK203_034430 [Vitis vinifera]|uniref:Uncharacterized protein n=1 Tax=Vitis vinifera TaxID=29760 RepID=A0A438HZE6_VITVI|nr:hypothetical protein CK203_034430 [Vitis vinifera]